MSVFFSEHSNEIYKSIIDYNPDGIVIFSIEGSIEGVNPAVTKILGYTMEEMIKLSYKDIFVPEQIDQVIQNVQQVKQGMPCEYEVDASHKNGTRVHLSVKNVPLIVNGKVVGIFGIAKDTTALKKVEQALRTSEERYRLIAQNVTDLVGTWDENGIVKYASPSHEQVLGFRTEEIEGKSTFDWIHPDDIPQVRSKLMSMVENRINEVVEFRYKHVQGNLIWIEAKGSPVIDDQGEFLHVLIVARDITERKLFEEKLNNMAYHDTLTGIANRRLFQARLEQTLKEAECYQRKLAIMYLDLDKFKYINDTYGHDAGDELLMQFSKRVQGCLRESDTLARQGGDEFTILLSEIQDEHAAMQIGERILEQLQAPWHIGDHIIQTTSSIGIAIYPMDGKKASQLMKNADTALYEAKDSGRNNVKAYSNLHSDC